MESIFTEEEFKTFKSRLHSELVPKLSEVRRNWESNFSGAIDQKADEYMERFNEILNIVVGLFESDKEVVTKVEYEANKVKNWISENMTDEVSDRSERVIDEVPTTTTTTTRDIFDDVDER